MHVAGANLQISFAPADQLRFHPEMAQQTVLWFEPRQPHEFDEITQRLREHDPRFLTMLRRSNSAKTRTRLRGTARRGPLVCGRATSVRPYLSRARRKKKEE